MPIAGIDHIALPTTDGERFLDFYKRLGFSGTDEAEWRAGRYPREHCDSGQGYLFGRPLETDAVEQFLASRSAVGASRSGAGPEAGRTT